jgi:tetratricopeptide (TPR) repeat protein
MASSPSTSLTRFTGIFVLLLGLTGGVLGVIAALQASPLVIGAFAFPILSLITGLGLWAGLMGIARVLERPVPKQGEVLNALGQLTMLVGEMRDSMAELASPAPPMPLEYVEPAPSQASPPRIDEQQIEKMVRLLEELKELALLDETQRHARRQQAMTRRKLTKLDEVTRLIHQRQWAQAEALLQLLESMSPKDADVMDRRRELNGARAVAASHELEQIQHSIEDLMAVGQFDEALAAARQFAETFPTNEDGQALVHRVNHESEIFRERTAGRMYDEIKSHSERREWRAALELVQRLLEKFPNHPKSNKVRAQLHTIQSNAEIEERQEQEDRIQELIKSRRYAEAIDMSEALLTRFPNSPQAERLEEFLPKLRNIAIAEEAGTNSRLES